MGDFSDQVRQGKWKGFAGRRIKNVVNIGIGGSDLGPVMANIALTPYTKRNMKFFFVSNVDSTHLAETLRQVKAAETLFIIASKTFTTQETMSNALAAKEWFLAEAKKAGLSKKDAEAAVRHRTQQLQEAPARILQDGPPLQDGPLRAQHARHPRAPRNPLPQRIRCGELLRPPVRPVPLALPGVSPADGHGVERKERRQAGQRRFLCDGSDRVGRARSATSTTS